MLWNLFLQEAVYGEEKMIFSNTEQLQNFWKAFAEGNTEEIEKYLNKILSNSVSVFDTRSRKEEKESSYHNLLVGILTGNADWLDQIKDRRYHEYLLNDGRNDILLYGMAFCKKRCRVVVERM